MSGLEGPSGRHIPARLFLIAGTPLLALLWPGPAPQDLKEPAGGEEAEYSQNFIIPKSISSVLNRALFKPERAALPQGLYCFFF